MTAQRWAEPTPEPCQGCHYITGLMISCLGICGGMRCEADAEARAALWRSLPTTIAESAPSCGCEYHRASGAVLEPEPPSR